MFAAAMNCERKSVTLMWLDLVGDDPAMFLEAK